MGVSAKICGISTPEAVRAAVVGVMGPLTLRRLSIDPAVSAGVILTTFTDCIGFATLLGLGTLFLL